MSNEHLGFAPEAIAPVAAVASRTVGLPSCDLKLLRLGQNLMFWLPGPGVVVRVARDSSYLSTSVKEVEVARWLGENSFEAARTVELAQSQPITIDGHPITFWQYVEGSTAGQSDLARIGDLLRRFHLLPPPGGVQLPVWLPLDRVDERIEQAEIPDTDKEFLVGKASELRAQLPRLSYELGVGVNHGDVHIKNVIVTPAGVAVLLDFEAVCLGHREWDLAKIATEAEMGMIAPERYSEFAKAYGHDVRGWEGFPTVRAVMQLRMTTWLGQNVAHSAAVRDEFNKRLNTLRTGRLQDSWRGF